MLPLSPPLANLRAAFFLGDHHATGLHFSENSVRALDGPFNIKKEQHGMTASQRPFKVLGIQQVAIGGTDKERMKKLWVDMLGLEQTGTFQSERENVDEDILSMGRGAMKVEVDIMQPMDPDKKPAVHATPLNHIGLWIDDLPLAVQWLTAQGVRFAPGGIRPGAAGYDICFLHPKSNEEFPIAGEGVLIELVQAPADVIAALG